jgi:predicted membrane protein
MVSVITKKIKHMKRTILKKIFAATILGTAIFLMPYFFLKVAAFFILTSMLIRIFIKRKMKQVFGGHYPRPAFTDTLRTVNNEEYMSLKRKAKRNSSTDIQSIDID